MQHANLLLQVVDISDPSWESHIRVVLEVLRELDVDKPMLYVFNKADLVPETQLIENKISKYQPNVLVSSITKNGLEPLKTYLSEWAIKQSKQLQSSNI